ncbi:MAG: RnfABCDGE type electron transport complex subunit B [Rhodoferax sp.]|nr:RnfABCDGE type electron transport complex subunit B [Rhodoferax sp.]
MASIAAQILDALPQTQCTRCGYPDCESYALAIASGQAAINQCPPGGAQGVVRLAAITGQPVLPLNPDNGMETPRSLAVIDEVWCIGCTLCIKACPTDAIIGSNKVMHTVIEAYCTGCELCIPACPVDCITLEITSGNASGWDAWSPRQAALARARHAASRSRQRLQPVAEPNKVVATVKPGTVPPGASPAAAPLPPSTSLSRQDVIAAAQTRARALRQKRN